MMPEYHRNKSDNMTDQTLLRMFDVEECLSTNDYQQFKECILKNRAVGCAKDVEHMN